MTLMILFGGVAALYLVRLLLRLASFALPVGLGLCAFLVLRGQGFGLAAASAMALLTGVVVQLTARRLFARSASASFRFLIGLLFTVPAGVAGAGGGMALAQLFGVYGCWRTCLAFLAGIAVACASWRSLAAGRSSTGAVRHIPTVR